MSRDFSLVTPNTAVSVRDVPPAIVEDVEDMWKAISENGGGHHLQVPFENETDAKAWLVNAQAYAKGQGKRLRKVRDDSLPAHVLRVHIETAQDYAKRQADAKAKAKELAERKAKGEIITRGRKPGSKTAKA